MEWKKNGAYAGQTRIVTRWCIFPRTIEYNGVYVTRWLQKSKIEQHCTQGGRYGIWYDYKFVD